MWTCGIAFSVFLSVAFTSELELYDHNGWIPVSSDILYNQIRRGTQAPRYTKADDVKILNTDLFSIVSQHNEYEEALPEEGIADEKVEKLYRGTATNVNDIVHSESGQPLQYNFLPVTLPQVKEPVDKTVRRSKKVADIDTNVPLKLLLHRHDKPGFKNTLIRDDKEQKYVDKLNETNSHTYEVTEKSTAEDEIYQEEMFLDKAGYEYNTPGKQELRNGFIKYLSKYTIGDSNNLQNYALSRRTKADNNFKQNILHNPLIFKVPNRYNSLNHLPVNPSLAVFLSNYGYYLQGQYGLQNNYNNLYGYLASNNIHNNRPFGLYKLFSDTDFSQ